MSFLKHIETCHRWDPSAYRPFVVADRVFGRVRHDLASRLADFGSVFDVDERGVALQAGLDDFEARSAAVAEVLGRLAQNGDLPSLRDEDYPLLRRWGDVPVMKIDRAAAAPFGIRSFGVHVNGLTRGEGRACMWIGRRARNRPVAPGKLDHIVAGGQPHGLTVADNLIKECGEEADVPPALAATARAASLVSYLCARPDGLRDDVLFCFDLDLPADFTPRNTDGEVEEFLLWPIEDVAARVRDTDDFKFNVNLVIIDLLVRQGQIGPDDPDYQDIVVGLRKLGSGLDSSV